MRGKQWLIFCIILLLSLTIAFSQGTIVSVLSLDWVKLSLTAKDGLQVGERLTVLRKGEPIALLQVYQVDESGSLAKIIEHKENLFPDIGDSVRRDFAASQSAFTPIPAPTPLTYKQLTSQEQIEDYNEMINKRTRVILIKGKDYKFNNTYSNYVEGSDIINAYDAVDMWDYSHWWSLGRIATIITRPRGKVEINPGAVDQGVTADSKIEIIFWDEKLCKSYVNYYAVKENITDPVAIEQLLRQQLEKRSADKYLAFQMRIENSTPNTVVLQPFADKVYLTDVMGNKYTLVKYDPQFDEILKAGDKVEGYMYFPKVKLDKKPLFGIDSSEIILTINNIMGNHSIRWNY